MTSFIIDLHNKCAYIYYKTEVAHYDRNSGSHISGMVAQAYRTGGSFEHRLFTLGMFIFLKPGLIWKLTEEWKSYRVDEPSEFYLKTTKIGGILFAIFGIIMIMLPVILE